MLILSRTFGSYIVKSHPQVGCILVYLLASELLPFPHPAHFLYPMADVNPLMHPFPVEPAETACSRHVDETNVLLERALRRKITCKRYYERCARFRYEHVEISCLIEHLRHKDRLRAQARERAAKYVSNWGPLANLNS